MAACVIGTDRSELLERTRRALARIGDTTNPEDALTGKADDWILGTVDEVVDRLRELESTGVERIFLQHLDHTDLAAVRLIAQEVAPAVKMSHGDGARTTPAD